jgi:hypothetical protein
MATLDMASFERRLTEVRYALLHMFRMKDHLLTISNVSMRARTCYALKSFF